MRYILYLLLLVIFYSCNVHKSSIYDLSDCELISLLINQLDILDEPKYNDIAILFISPKFTQKDADRLCTSPFSKVHHLDIKSCDNFNIKDISKVEILDHNPCDYSLANKYRDYHRNCLVIFVSNIYEYQNEYVMRIIVNSSGFYGASFKFKVKGKKLYDISMDDYYPNFEGGKKNLRDKYPMIKE